MGETILEVQNLDFSYPSRSDYALQDVNLNIDRGEMLAIIGQNGSGKTTLIKHFNGLLKPTNGRVIVEGRDTKDLQISELARSVGFVFQNPDHQIFATNIKDEVAFGPKNLGFSPERIEKNIQEVLKAMNLTDIVDKMPFQLSRGQRQRLAVASVLAMEPSILIIDEPTTGQDWKESIALMELVRGLNERGHTCIIVTHNMNLVSLFAKRVIVMRNAQIYLDGTTQDVFSQVELLHVAGIKTPEVYQLIHSLIPDFIPEKPLTPVYVAEILAERFIHTRSVQNKNEL